MSIRKGQTIVAGAGNTRRNIGEVYYSQSSLATDNSGALPLWTGESVATAMYPSLTEWVTKHTELQCTAEEYESALSTYGECPKYVLSGGYLRLPKLSNYVKIANSEEGITQGEAGLPNITGTFGGVRRTDVDMFSGAFTTLNDGYNGIDYSSGASWITRNSLDASLASEVYGNSDTVTPAHTTLFPWVVAYTASIEASVAQAAEFQQGLSGKVDLPAGKTNTDVDFVAESYSDENGNWYRVYKSGWIEQGGQYRTDTTQRQSWGVITFLKPFTDTNYTVQAVTHSPYRDATNLVYMGMASIGNKTTTKVDVGAYGFSNVDVNNGFDWYACGQGAE